MKPPLPRTLSAVPRTLHARLEIAKAIRTLAGPDEDELLRQRRTEIAAIRRDLEALSGDIRKAFEAAATLAKAELRAALKKYSADQARVPAGNSKGGQWTTGDGGSGSPSNSSDAASGGSEHPTRYAARDTGTLTDETPSAPSNSQTRNDSAKSPAQVAANEPSQQKPIDLLEEEAARGIGHTIADHVGKSDAELLEVINRKTWTPAATLTGHREGSFDSIGIAQDLVNRTLDAPENAARIADVVSGKQVADLITSKFDFITGREWYRPEPDDSPYLRVTSGVGVVIMHDPGVPRGYRILTAYPRND